MLSRVLRNYRLRSKTVTRAGAEMTVELQLRDSSDIVGHMLGTNGVYDATLVSCQSEAAI
jgi:voltage-gated potassium channel Kch